MKRIIVMVLLFAVTGINLDNVFAGVLATDENIINGKNNLTNPQLSNSVDFDTVIGSAVNFLLTGEENLGQAVKIEILRSALTALINLPEAKFVFTDVSSGKMYEALVMYDLISHYILFDDDEKASLKKSVNSVLSHYLDSEICDWSDDYWCLGVTAMRIVASCALYALNFPEDQNSDLYLKHSMLYFQKNLNNSIDNYGAWVPDSPGYTGEAVEYMIVTAKALRNYGFRDHFSNPNLKNLLLYEMHLMPPQQCTLVKDIFMIAGTGQTDPGVNHGAKAVIAAADIYPYFSDEASNIIWYWNQCGNPVEPLGLLFIDTMIPYMMPDGKSCVAGGGMAVLRNNFAKANESFVFAGFGDARGVHDREKHDHSDHGDFSFVWSGIPIIVHDGFNDYGCSEAIMNRAAWRHSLVLYEGAGNSPVVPESIYMNLPVKPDITGNGISPSDFYTDGISQFLSTEMVDYVCGSVRLTGSDMPAPLHYRHFLFLKPGALLIWDQVESPFPLEWNLWIPVENVQGNENLLRLFTRNNVELQVLFAGDNTLDFEIENPPVERNWDWPFVMRTEYGKGMITFLSLDLVNNTLSDSSAFALKVLQNILFQNGKPGLTGLISLNSELKEILTHLHINFEYLKPEDLSDTDLSRYSLLLIDSTGSAQHKSLLNDNIWKINDFIYNGGNAVWMCHSPSGYRTDYITGPGFIPEIIDLNGCFAEIPDTTDSAKNIIINEDPVWLEPNIINPDSLFWWISRSSFENDENSSEKVFSLYTPVAWSDSWNVLASVRKSFPLKAYSNDVLGKPSRIRVKHPESKDFFTLLLPRKTGEPYHFNITRHTQGFVSFEDPVTKWEIKAGETYWTDANLSVKISREGGFDTLYAFDCTYITSESEEISSDSPMSIYYSSKEDRGIIMTASNNVIKYSKGSMKLHAGEIYFYGLRNELSLERLVFVTDLRVVDSNGNNIEWADVHVDGTFVGSTDKNGRIPIRWKDQQPEVEVEFRGSKSSAWLVPGEMEIVIGVKM